MGISEVIKQLIVMAVAARHDADEHLLLNNVDQTPSTSRSIAIKTFRRRQRQQQNMLQNSQKIIVYGLHRYNTHRKNNILYVPLNEYRKHIFSPDCATTRLPAPALWQPKRQTRPTLPPCCPQGHPPRPLPSCRRLPAACRLLQCRLVNENKALPRKCS
jgi:hypothetical protein